MRGRDPYTWRDVQPRLGRLTRTCSYDREGLGGSARVPGIHDAADEVEDLEQLLDRADIEPPYVLVGHSYGGVLARLYANEHPDDVAGVALVDAAHRDWVRRILAIIPRNRAFARLRRDIGQQEGVVQGVDLRASLALDRRVRSLGKTPLVVVTGGKLGWPDLALSLRRSLADEWDAMQAELATLSSESVHVVALRSDHFVHSFLTGQPDVVIRAVQALVRADRRDARLDTCARIFRGLTVRCRG